MSSPEMEIDQEGSFERQVKLLDPAGEEAEEAESAIKNIRETWRVHDLPLDLDPSILEE